MKLIYSLIVCGLFSAGCTASYDCPPKIDISPCTCFDLAGIDITCPNLTTVNELKRALEATRNLEHFYLSIWDSNIDNVPNNIFQGAKIITLFFTNTQFTFTASSGEPHLVGLENVLEVITVHDSYRSKDKPMTAPSLGNLKVLWLLDIAENYISKLGNDWFENGPTSLKDIKFYKNTIEEIEDKAFARLENLKSLEISSTPKISLSRSMLPKPANYLHFLNLNGNDLTSLPDDFFSDMPKMQTVLLYKNAFTTVSEATWSPVWNLLDEIDLYSNPLVCDSGMKWIYQRGKRYHLKGECSEPEHLEGKSLAQLELSDFQ